LISASTVSFELAQQTGEKKTALTDANRKKENSYNRCQSKKKKTALTDANRKKENSYNRCQSKKKRKQL
jgi:hypothetical protein